MGPIVDARSGHNQRHGKAQRALACLMISGVLCCVLIFQGLHSIGGAAGTRRSAAATNALSSDLVPTAALRELITTKPSISQREENVILNNCDLIRNVVYTKWVPLATRNASGHRTVHISFLGDSLSERQGLYTVEDVKVCLPGHWLHERGSYPYHSPRMRGCHMAHVVIAGRFGDDPGDPTSQINLIFSSFKMSHLGSIIRSINDLYGLPYFPERSPAASETREKEAWLSPRLRLPPPTIVYTVGGAWDSCQPNNPFDGYNHRNIEYYTLPNLDKVWRRVLQTQAVFIRDNYSTPLLRTLSHWRGQHFILRYNLSDAAVKSAPGGPPMYFIMGITPSVNCQGYLFKGAAWSAPPTPPLSPLPIDDYRYLRGPNRCDRLVKTSEAVVASIVRETMADPVRMSLIDKTIYPRVKLVDWYQAADKCPPYDGVHLQPRDPACRAYIIDTFWHIF